MKFYLWRWL